MIPAKHQHIPANVNSDVNPSVFQRSIIKAKNKDSVSVFSENYLRLTNWIQLFCQHRKHISKETVTLMQINTFTYNKPSMKAVETTTAPPFKKLPTFIDMRSQHLRNQLRRQKKCFF